MNTQRTNQRGFTLLETTIWMVLGVTISGLVASTVSETIGVTTLGQQSASLQDTGRLALQRIAEDLNRSGLHTIDGVALPHVFSNGLPDSRLGDTWTHDTETLASHAEHLATMGAPTQWSAGTNPEPFVAPGDHNEPRGVREIVFALPADRDGDGRPVSATDGSIEWGDNLVGYLMIPSGDGTFDLIRRQERADAPPVDVRICRWVTALTFDTTATKPILPRNAVEVHLHLERPAGNGHSQTLHHYTTITMRNLP